MKHTILRMTTAAVLLIGPFVMFLFIHRFPDGITGKRGRKGVLITNLGIAAMALILSFAIGPLNYLLIQVPVMTLGGAAGIWLFFQQHNFERVHWVRQEKWDIFAASMEGSSFYRLPGILRFFSGNIGYHHIHHVQPRIPGYRLKEAFDNIPALRDIPALTLWKSFRNIRLHLWDERAGNLVGFRRLRKA